QFCLRVYQCIARLPCGAAAVEPVERSADLFELLRRFEHAPLLHQLVRVRRARLALRFAALDPVLRARAWLAFRLAAAERVLRARDARMHDPGRDDGAPARGSGLEIAARERLV